jgi:hypothetical protein
MERPGAAAVGHLPPERLKASAGRKKAAQQQPAESETFFRCGAGVAMELPQELRGVQAIQQEIAVAERESGLADLRRSQPVAVLERDIEQVRGTALPSCEERYIETTRQDWVTALEISAYSLVAVARAAEPLLAEGAAWSPSPITPPRRWCPSTT